MNIAPYISQYEVGKDILDQAFTAESVAERWLVSSSKYIKLDFHYKGQVLIMSILVDGAGNYYKANHAGVANSGNYAHDNSNNLAGARDGLPRGNVQSEWVAYSLRFLRGKQIPIDWVDDEEEANKLIANTLNVFLRSRFVPEFDTLCFSTMADNTYTSFGNRLEGAITANTIISQFDNGIKFMTESGVPLGDVVIFVNPKIMQLIKETTELVHYILQSDFKSTSGVTFKLPSYNGCPIVEVMSDRFYTKAVAGENGVTAGATSYQINFIIANREAVIPVKKLEWSQVYDNSVVTDFKGYLIDFLAYYDFIVPVNKTSAIFASVDTTTPATAVTNVLRVGLVEGTVAGMTNLKVAITAPSNMAGTVVYSATAFTVGTKYTIDGATIVAVPKDTNNYYTQFTPVSTAVTGGQSYFALLDGSGTCIATSVQVTLPIA